MFKKIGLLISFIFFSSVAFSQIIDIEKKFDVPAAIPEDVSVDLEKLFHIPNDYCRKSKAAEIFEASEISVGGVEDLLIKPKELCICGAYYCPIVMYERRGSKYVNVLNVAAANEIKILNNVAGGHKNIISVTTSIHGVTSRKWYWDGMKYTQSK